MEYILPCKIGDVVYIVINKSILKSVVEYFIIHENGATVVFENTWPIDRADANEFGKTIFFAKKKQKRC